MEEKMRRSQAGSLWEMIATLSRLGWSPRMIGEAARCSSQTVVNDIKGKGETDSLFPNRPHGKTEVYAATFEFWLDCRKNARDSMIEAIEGYLQIDKLIGFAEGMEWARSAIRSIGQQATPATEQKVRSNIWIKYLQEVSAGQREAPNCFDRAIGELQQAFIRLAQNTRPEQSRLIGKRPQVKASKLDVSVLSRNVSTLKLPVRAANCIEALGIRTIGQLIQCKESDLVKVQGLGPKTLHQIRDALAELELNLGTNLPITIVDKFPIPQRVIVARRTRMTA